MTDRELLEYAAKAAGIEVWFPRMADGNGGVLEPCHISRNGQTEEWNPFDDDGDALRLLVQLGIDLEWRRDGRVAAYRRATSNEHWFVAIESSREDRNANTRRAIVCAAAEIGRSKP